MSVPIPLSRRVRSREAAAHLGVGLSTLTKWRMNDTGPAYIKFGKSVVYDTAELDAWAEHFVHRPSGKQGAREKDEPSP
ncbi:hypothetical protein B0E45_14630 [Sinorhizobium sp. A49]|uniref:helix-turn-helix transcriptional regulator n=1 Tax=Sinorhizobium sp. A49 TaxID=1945861 RepID=UPI000985CCB9|nr:helix-turn-helix domain-containing protein [Sinorhizobium sp. A49]OOG70033.1 hypothetical protein B0E45_14630 [Sinorhizobium sp. A49]